jgi:hypothetical protein
MSKLQQICDQIDALHEMIDGKCCHKDFINQVIEAINTLEKLKKYC